MKLEVRWLKAAAEGEDPQSICNLGVCYFNGKGVDMDREHALALYRQAASAGDEWACYLLGLCYSEGDSVRRNPRVARSWLVKAAQAGVKGVVEMLEAI